MRNLLLGLGLLLPAFACSTYSPETAPGRSTTGRDFARRDCDPCVDNMARVADGIYRGAQPDAETFKTLKARGFKSIINLRAGHSEQREADASGLKVYDLPMEAGIFGSTAPSQETIDKFLAIVCDESNRPVFFHCAHGKDRTGTMAAIYRIAVDGWTNAEAIEEMHAFGYHTIYQDLINCVRDYRCPATGVSPAAATRGLRHAAPEKPIVERGL